MVSYKKLWKLLIDKDMEKKDLMEVANISPATVAKMTKGENINTEVLVKICNAFAMRRCRYNGNHTRRVERENRGIKNG